MCVLIIAQNPMSMHITGNPRLAGDADAAAAAHCCGGGDAGHHAAGLGTMRQIDFVRAPPQKFFFYNPP